MGDNQTSRKELFKPRVVRPRNHEGNRPPDNDLKDDDIKISKLLRKLNTETNLAASLDICDKLKVAIQDPSNSGYLRRCFDILADSVIAAFESAPLDALDCVAEVFGMMGYVARNEFTTYKAWIVKTYKNAKHLQLNMMQSLLVTLKLDRNSHLQSSAGRLIELLKDFLEQVETARVFIGIMEVIGQFSKNYPKHFEPHFKDIVDICVGWHLEMDQKAYVKHECSRVLQTFQHYWKKDTKFTTSLLGQFLEDIEAFHLDQTSDGEKSSEVSLGSFISAFNTVLKCVSTSPEILFQSIGKDFLEHSLQMILNAALPAIKTSSEEDAVLPVNELLILLLPCQLLGLLLDRQIIQEILVNEISHLPELTDNTVLSLLAVINKFIETVKNDLPLEFLDHLFEAGASPLMQLRFRNDKRIHYGLITIFHHVLDIKNVPILQRMYKHLLNDMQKCLNALFEGRDDVPLVVAEAPSSGHYTEIEAKIVFQFNLLAITKIATTSNSLMAMWAFQPSILELLALTLHLSDESLWEQYEQLNFAGVKLLASHCMKNSNFFSASSLIKPKLSESFGKLSLESNSSPTAANLEIILKFLEHVVSSEAISEDEKRLSLIVDWCKSLFVQIGSHLSALKDNQEFLTIVAAINRLSITPGNENITKSCATCLDCLTNIEILSDDVLQQITEVCCIQMCSTSSSIRDIFSHIFAKIPLRFSLKQVNHFTGINKLHSDHIVQLQHWHYRNGVSDGSLQPQFFKDFIQNIGFSRDQVIPIDIFAVQAFLSSWYQEMGPSNAFKEMSEADVRPIISWLEWQGAQYCVENKLKTTLGKPQETFLKIEALIKEDARVLSLKEKGVTVKGIRTYLGNQKNAKILLGFLEALEKTIHNASDGTAFALPACEKPARTFFRVNTSTCSEWFTRIGSAINLVALHCMLSEQVIRYSEVVLHGLCLNKKQQEPMFAHTLMSLTWALVRTGEANALYGLYAWSKKMTGMKFLWIKLAAEQTAGHKEIAADGYLQILKENDDARDEDKLHPNIRDFIVDMTTMCLLYSGKLDLLRKFLQQEENRSEPRSTIPIISINSKQVESMMMFDTTLDPNVLNLSSWETLQFDKGVPSDFSCHKMVNLTENSLVGLVLDPESPKKQHLSKQCFKIIHSLLQDSLRTRSTEYLNQLTVINHICHKIASNDSTTDSLNVDKTHGSYSLHRLLEWSNLFTRVTCYPQNNELRLDIVGLSRKERNFDLCKRELERFYSTSALTYIWPTHGNQLSIDLVHAKLIEKAYDHQIWDKNMSRAIYEQCKLMYWLPGEKIKAIQLAAVATTGISEAIDNDLAEDSRSLREPVSRFMLKLSQWIQAETQLMSFGCLDALIRNIPDIRTNHEPGIPSILSGSDTVIGKLIQESTRRCPDLAKGWYMLGAWFYRWGRKLVEQKNERGAKLKSVDIMSIKQTVPDATDDDILMIGEIFERHQATAEEEDIGTLDGNSTEVIENELRTVPCLKQISYEHIHEIVQVWKQAHKTVYRYYEKSAESYFKFLQLTNTSSERIDDKLEGWIVTATLRILRLIVKHALGLQDVLDQGLLTTPSDPWKTIIPQLFSRLNHHEPYVRRRVSELLCRVAKDSPHLIIFPSVVGAAEEQSVNIAEISKTSEDFYDDIDMNQGSGLAFCFNALLDTLSQQSPETVSQVQLFVKELRRVTLLWDEIWMVSMTQVYAESAKKIQQFEQEWLQSKENPKQHATKQEIFVEKYKILIRPIIFVMQRLHQMTSRSPETNNEKYFQEKYMRVFENLMRELEQPFNSENPITAWQKFKLVYNQMQQRAQRRSAYVLQMQDISPTLFQMKDTAISMPGIQLRKGIPPVYIKSVDNTVVILPTKTKPKKLIFHGSDGKQYAYLFKGLEDLHLDERIMQFLSIANLMMTNSVNCDGNVTVYRAHHYPVIPLGPRSGLISWVDNVVPVFALYKKWQQREAANPKKNKQFVVQRPSEMFYEKLNPLLQANGMKSSDPRKDWPLPVLKEVLSQLQSETPSDLLSKELWCHSTNVAEWRQIIKRYSLSTAVMSVIGYIIGLGDRHLDNMLINLSTGEIVHIDYNVCFEKGKTLRVPEKVPFRMTPNLEEALGVTGIEGTFRLSCEHVLESLKKGRETLLTLLEAFVYDPLVDWAIGEDIAGGLAVTTTYGDTLNCDLLQASKQLEREVTRDTLAIRFTEIKADWLQNRDEIKSQLSKLSSYFNLLIQQRSKLQEVEHQYGHVEQQLQFIEEAKILSHEMLAMHPLNTVSQRYAVFKKYKDDFDTINRMLMDKTKEYLQLLKDYKQHSDDVLHKKLLEYAQELDESLLLKYDNEFDVVQDFLLNSNQNVCYTKGAQARLDLSNSMLQQSMTVRSSLQILIQYNNVSQFLPPEYCNYYCTPKHLDWLKYVTEKRSSEACRDVALQYQRITSAQDPNVQSQVVSAFAYQQQSVMNELQTVLQMNVDCLANELGRGKEVAVSTEYKEAKVAISRFIAKDFAAKKALECVALTALCDVNKRFLMLELAANNAGENLINFMTDEKWFLDELFLYSSLIVELLGLIPNDGGKNGYLQLSVKAMKEVNQMYGALRELYSKFCTELLPETMRSVISGDESVLSMIQSISDLWNRAIPLQETLSRELSGVEVTSNDDLTAEIDEIRDIYTSMMTQNHSGGSLLKKVNASFDAVNKKYVNILEIIDKIERRTDLLAIDHVREALGLMKTVTSHQKSLENLFFVKKLESLLHFFTECLQSACAFKGTEQGNAMNSDLHCRPIKHYIATFVWRAVFGIGPLSTGQVIVTVMEGTGFNLQVEIGKKTKESGSLEELCKKTVNFSLNNEVYSVNLLNQASSLCITLDKTWKKRERVIQLQETIKKLKDELNTVQLLSSAHYWLHEHALVSQPNLFSLCPVSRAGILLQLKNSLQNLGAWHQTVELNKTLVQGVTTDVLQRLKWAVGANPSLEEILTEFNTLSTSHRNKCDKECLLAAVCTKYAQSIWNFEIQRFHTPEGFEKDKEFLQIISSYEQACIILEQYSTLLTPIEEALVELLDPEGPIDHVWLSNVQSLLKNILKQLSSEITDEEKLVVTAQDKLQMHAHTLRTLMGHHHMSSDIRALLKRAMKLNEAHQSNIREYLIRYKLFIDTISELYTNVLSKDFTEKMVEVSLKQISMLDEMIMAVYDDLFNFDLEELENENTTRDQSPIPMVYETHQKAQTQKEQKRNAYAVSVWRRIRMKLEGRDRDPNKRQSLQEQVDWMIREAMNPDNLAVLYEGWTPWV